MAKSPTTPIKVTAHLVDGRINSADGILMLDSILYHAWFYKHAPQVMEGVHKDNYSGHMGLPLRQLPGGRYAASRGVYAEAGNTVEYINKRPDFFAADKIDHLDADKGIINSSVGKYRSYRMPHVIRTAQGSTVTFWALGHRNEVQELLDVMPGLGKKVVDGYGLVERWEVEDCEEDYSLWHPEYGLMRPVEVGSDEAKTLDLSGYPVMQYGCRPPYWKACNMRLCYVPVVSKA